MKTDYKNIIAGVRIWINYKIKQIREYFENFVKTFYNDILFAISAHFNELYELVEFKGGKNINIDQYRNISALGYLYDSDKDSISLGETTVVKNKYEHAAGAYNKSHRKYFDPDESHLFVDLGLPSGTIWAKYNLGGSGTGSTVAGDYYAWGEKTTKTYYDWTDPNNSQQNYKYAEGTGYTLTKYCQDATYGTVDNFKKLLLDDDVAYDETVGYGHLYNLPTKEQIDELWENTTRTYKTASNSGYGVPGYEFKNRNQDLSTEVLFIPISGMKTEDTINTTQSIIWSSYLNQANDGDDNTQEVDPREVYCLRLWRVNDSTYGIDRVYAQRRVGGSVRPVSNKLDSKGSIHTIGIGTEDGRLNAIEVMNDGEIYIKGIGGYDGIKTKDDDPNIKTLLEYITDLETRIYNLEHPNQ